MVFKRQRALSILASATFAIGMLLTVAASPVLAQAWLMVTDNPVVFEEPATCFGTDSDGYCIPCSDESMCCDVSDDGCCNVCEGCCCDCGPRWTIRAGAVFLQRSKPSHDIMLQNTVSGQALERFSQFSFDMEAGPDLYVRRKGERFDLEGRFFMVDGWSSVIGPSNTSAIWNLPWDPELFGLGVAGNTYTYTSELHSAELNARRCLSRNWDWLAGFRYVELDERILVDANFGGNEAEVLTRSTNHLYGFQVGGDGILWNAGGRIRLENTAKAGIYYNHAGTWSEVSQDIGPDFGTRGEGNRTSFLGEYDINAVYQLTRCMSIRAGYQLLFLDGVAVVSDQYPMQNVLGTSEVDLRDGIFYHGASVSVETSW